MKKGPVLRLKRRAFSFGRLAPCQCGGLPKTKSRCSSPTSHVTGYTDPSLGVGMRVMETSSAATSTTGIAPEKSHYVVLDGLRGVASVLVVVFHLFEAYAQGQPQKQI